MLVRACLKNWLWGSRPQRTAAAFIPSVSLAVHAPQAAPSRNGSRHTRWAFAPLPQAGPAYMNGLCIKARSGKTADIPMSAVAQRDYCDVTGIPGSGDIASRKDRLIGLAVSLQTQRWVLPLCTTLNWSVSTLISAQLSGGFFMPLPGSCTHSLSSVYKAHVFYWQTLHWFIYNHF